MRRILAFFFIVCLFAAGIGSTQAQTVIVLDTAQKSYSLEGKIGVLIDESRQLTFEDVSQRSQNWQPLPSFNFGSTQAAVWLKITTKHKGEDWAFELDNFILRHVDFYRPKTDGGWRHISTGNVSPKETRDLPARAYLFQLPNGADTAQTVYLRVQTETVLNLPLTIWQKEDWQAAEQENQWFYGLLLGGVLVIGLYNLFLFLSTRDRVYIFYLCYLVMFGLWSAFERGYIMPLVLPYFNPTLLFYLVGTTTPLALASFTHFIRLFLQINGRRNFVDRVMIGLLLSYLFIAVFIFIDIFHAIQLIYLFGFIGSIVNVTASIVVYLRGNKQALYLLAAISFLTVGATFYVFAANQILPNTFLNRNALLLGFLCEMVMLSFALGNKINTAQKAAIESALENARLIEEQNEILETRVDERTRELANANEELNQLNEELSITNDSLEQTLQEVNRQKAVIEEKNNDILDSIHYARRIQTAILPDPAYIQSVLPNAFVFYRPRDVVSGDFYWFAHFENEGLVILAAVDCTGHGVPGAFMSIMGYNLLNAVIHEQGQRDPGEILRRMDEGVRLALHQTRDSASRDGMDAALAVLNLKPDNNGQFQLRFAGANRPLYLLRKGATEIEEQKSDKSPVGGYAQESKRYQTFQFALNAGDFFYLFSDGITDQFGGEQRRKFTPKRLKETLLSVAESPAKAQGSALEKSFTEWMGDNEQLDDVMIIGVGC